MADLSSLTAEQQAENDSDGVLFAVTRMQEAEARAVQAEQERDEAIRIAAVEQQHCADWMRRVEDADKERDEALNDLQRALTVLEGIAENGACASDARVAGAAIGAAK